MDDVSYRRIGAIAGIAGMVLIVVGFLLPGAPPKADDPVTEFTELPGRQARREPARGHVLIGLGAALLLTFFSALRGQLDCRRAWRRPRARGLRCRRRHGHDQPDRDGDLRRSRVRGRAGSATTCSIARFSNAAEVFDDGRVRGGGVLLRGGGVCLESGGLPRWTVPTGYAVGVIQLVSTVAVFASSGFFAAGEPSRRSPS